MAEYKKPELEIIELNSDVITTSGDDVLPCDCEPIKLDALK